MLQDSPLSLRSAAREMALAWQKLGLYQPGHPAREAVVERAHALLAGLMAPTGGIALGVGRDGLLGPEEKITLGPVAKLADALYQNSVAVLRFEEGLEVRELETLFALIPRGGGAVPDPPLWERLAAQGVRHVHLDPIDFSAVVTVEGEGEEGLPTPSSLWDEILQRALANPGLAGLLGSTGVENASLARVLELVERVLGRHRGGAAGSPGDGGARPDTLADLEELLGDAVTAGLATAADGTGRRAVARHVAELLTAIPEQLQERVLDVVLEELAAGEGVEGGFESLTGSLHAAQMVASLRRLRAEKVEFSPRLLQLIEDLVVDAAPDLAGSIGVPNADELTAGLRELAGQDVDLAPAGRAPADRLALALRQAPPLPARPRELEPRLASLEEVRVLVQLGQTLLELLQRPVLGPDTAQAAGQRLESTFRTLLASGRVVNAIGVVKELQRLARSREVTDEVRAVAASTLEGLRQGETISALVESLGDLPQSSIGQVHELIELLGPAFVQALLEALSEEEELRRRRHLFDLLVSLGSRTVPEAVRQLDDPRWFVRRNALSLLRHIGEGVTPALLAKGLAHEDARVRAEAVKCLGVVADVPESLLGRAVADPEPKVAEAAVLQIGAHRLRLGTRPLVELLRRPDPLARHKELRVRSLATLGEIGDPAVLPEIRHFFRVWLATVSPDERRAAFSSLAGYPPEARSPYVRQGLRCLDGEVRRICQELDRAEGAS